jgi:hypothetical protein
VSLMSWTSALQSGRASVRKMKILACLAPALLLQTPASAQSPEPLPAPEGPVILTVTGKVGVTNTEGGAAFDRQMLQDVGVTELNTTTPWLDGAQEFTGVLAKTLLERVGAQGTTVTATALNDYTVAIPMDDFQNYDVLLATEMNGEEMLVSDKGPIWIVYPRDDHSELRERRISERWVWQLKALEVQ